MIRQTEVYKIQGHATPNLFISSISAISVLYLYSTTCKAYQTFAPNFCMDVPRHFSTFNTTKQIKLMAHVLTKMAKFFNEMAELCLTHLSDSQSGDKMKRLAVNRQNLQRFESQKVLQKLDSRKEVTKPVKREQSLKKIKSHKPKHPVSSFFIFYKDKGQEIAKKKGEVLGSKIAKVVGQLWKTMTQSQKQPYEAMAKVARQKYEEEMVEYKIKYTDELARLKQYKREARLRRKAEEEVKALIKPTTEEKLEKDNQVVVQKDKQLNQMEGNQIESSSQNSELELEDDLSDSLQSSLRDEPKASKQADQQPPKGMNQSPQVKKQSSQIRQEISQLKQTKLEHNQGGGQLREESSSNSIGSYEQSSSHQYHEALFHPINFEDDFLPQQHLLIDLSHTSPLKPSTQPPNCHSQMLNLQKETTLHKAEPKQQDEIQLDELCSISDSDMLSDVEPPAEQFTKPKGPVSSFFLFYREKGKQISEAKGLPLGPKVIKVASQIWKQLSEQQKQVYKDRSKQTRQEYNKHKQELRRRYGEDIFQRSRGVRPARRKNKKAGRK